ncbi:hypothetical protein MPK66_gp241 [Erwinia phage pEa_SNUABM_2]|uniref:Uncharacterized protein n=1 Tax=Erwinia phage pEa_SNUABM_2 TaxID=2869547 RepID=A0AAE8C1A4_9CAUD|nr:hypothetical protein MPK66_gp241 [Erwinia phage pEa_SNUABM_2]QZE59485.1 hypothetical protein pEaSNUABM2_00241 [Erwinia phage pEa_SNUABM_2]QZE59821.1 hypothetical protein pEaSNUABM39_00241 [Erwinia phage pEa_SNUABM_39]
MEMLVSLSHEIRVEKQDNAATEAQTQGPTDAQQTALDIQEQRRIVEEYGIDASKEEVADKEKDRIEREEEQADEKRIKPPADLGQRKPIEDKDLTATDIQNQHDNLTKI